MRRLVTIVSLLLLLALALLPACQRSAGEGAGQPDAGTDADTDTDTDVDSDTDSDGDSDEDTGEDTDSETSSESDTDPGCTDVGPDEEVCIDFDEVAAPCDSIDAVALRDEYEALGVVFSGASDLDGGAIFDACSNFGVWNYSEPNFVGFNCILAELADGGKPCPPQYIDFTVPVSAVRLRAAGATGPLTLTAYDESDAVLDTQTLVLGDWLHDIEVAGGCIVRVSLETGYPSPIPGCSPSSEPGCDGCECESCVCEEAPSCCDEEWAWQCADLCMWCGQECAPWMWVMDDLCFE